LFFSASNAFKHKGWQRGEAGIGFAVAKVQQKTDKPAISIKVAHDDNIYKVSPKRLLAKIEEKDCYNKNGRFICGYITKNDLFSLARGSKEDRKTN